MNSLSHQNYKNENTETKNSWYNGQLTLTIFLSSKKTVGAVKDKTIGLFKVNPGSKPTLVNNVHEGRKKPRK